MLNICLNLAIEILVSMASGEYPLNPFMEQEMKKLSSVLGIVLVASTSWAHLPVGEVFPAVQFPDDKVPTVDGNLADWESIPDAYWINHEQLTETVRGVGTAWDATDLALRAIVGWNPTTNKLYVMEDRFDDAVWVTTGWEPMEMVFDADHSGGMFNVWPDAVSYTHLTLPTSDLV